MKAKLIFVALAAPLILSACGTSAPETSISSNEKLAAGSTIGTNGQLIPITSSNVLAAGFDAETFIMSVKFNNGAIYEYYDVPTTLWEEFVAAQPHPWSEVGYPRLVQGGFVYKRIA